MEVIVQPFEAGSPFDPEVLFAGGFVPLFGPPAYEAGNEEDDEDEGTPADNGLSVFIVKEQAPVYAFNDIKEVVFIVDMAGNSSVIRVDEDGFVVLEGAEVGGGGVIAGIGHNFPGAVWLDIGDDIIGWFGAA